jgi:cytochrome c-type biogenesis protein CcmH
MIWLVFALLTGAAVMSVLWPLGQGSEPADPAATDIAFFEEQIAEIERERAEGRLSPQDAESARAEAARRLLRARAESAAGVEPSRRNALIAAGATIVLVPVLSVLLYSRLGHSNLPDAPLQARLDAKSTLHDLAAAVARIEAHLAEHPEDGRGFEVVAPVYLREGRLEEAVNAFSQALRLLGATPQRHSSLGEARVLAAGGTVTPEARRDFEAALALDPSFAMARYYLGLAAAQNDERDKAIDIWSKLLDDSPPDAPWRERLSARLSQLRGSPQASEQAAKIAALPEGQRLEAIRSMVERLRGRLEQNGDDVEGWLKLIRAYSVLAESDRARTALDDARKALANDKNALARIDALARELGVGG